jgi:hypothetical protein
MARRNPLRALFLPLSLALLAACTAPTTNPAPEAPGTAQAQADAQEAAPPTATSRTRADSDTPGTPASTAATPPIKPPRMSDPLPPEVLPAPVKLDRSCRTDADCSVKDVGNCCGHYPSCVNVDSPTDPEGVQAQCAQRGMVSVCGHPVLEGCACVQGQCEDRPAMVDPVRGEAPVDR